MILVILDMLKCSLIYGALFTEYYDLDFINRKRANRKTFITTFYNLELYKKINLPEYRYIFRNKVRFYEKFHKYIKRDWVEIDDDKSKWEVFLEGKDKIVLKNRTGDSGKEVIIYKIENENIDSILSFMKENGLDLAEDFLENHEKLSYFNQNSLNTIRIVTISNKEETRFLFAGLRIGAKDSSVDNISQGGTVACIDLYTGKIKGKFYSKKSSKSKSSIEGYDAIEYQIPYWNQLLDMIRKAARVVPQIAYVAWDVAITQNGPVIVEGNESFGSVILQTHLDKNQEGLKPRLETILKDLKLYNE